MKAVHRVHERIANKREDFVQKLSLSGVKSYDLMVFEDLNIIGMVKPLPGKVLRLGLQLQSVAKAQMPPDFSRGVVT